MLASSYPRFRGDIAGPFIQQLAEALAARGHDIEVFAPRDPLLHNPPKGQAKVHWYRYAVGAFQVLGYGRSLVGDQRLKLTAIATMPVYLASGFAALAARHAMMPFDHFHGHWLVPGGFQAALAGTLLRRPVTISMHGSDLFVARQTRFVPFARWALLRAQAVAGSSPDLAAGSIALGGLPERTHFVPYGVDVDLFRPATGPDGQTVATVGRMVGKKGFATLIDAVPIVLAACPDARFVIGGDGALLNTLKAQAHTLGVADRVSFPGSIPWPSMPGFLAAADVVTVPSVVDEMGNMDGLPNVTLEAMASGKAVVGSRVGGIAAALARDAGVVVPPADPAALAAAIIELLQYPARRHAFGIAARKRAEDTFSWDAIAAVYEQLYLGKMPPDFAL